jgi:hypothetical protein
MANDTDPNASDKTAGVSRKEDYKSYAERDIDEGWPYSDEPGREEDRLERNRPYASEAAEQTAEAGREGFHLEEVPATPDEAGMPAEVTGVQDETVRDYIDHPPDPGNPREDGADPDDDPTERH